MKVELLQRSIMIMDSLIEDIEKHDTNYKVTTLYAKIFCDEHRTPKKKSHFNPKEFVCKCGCGLDDINPRLYYCLEKLRASCGDKPIRITPHGGCRCHDYNKVVGGAFHSQHKPNSIGLCNAADIKISGMKPWEIAAMATKAGFTGIGIGSTICHVDVRSNNDMSKIALARKYSLWTYKSNERYVLFLNSLLATQ